MTKCRVWLFALSRAGEIRKSTKTSNRREFAAVEYAAMKRTTPIMVTIIASITAVCAGQVTSTPTPAPASISSSTDSVDHRSPDSITEVPSAGFWPTERLTRSLIRRWAQQIEREYDLRPDQFRQVEQHLLERWPKFLKENRGEIQPLVNEFFELRMDVEPPTAEQVSDWSSRVMPVFERTRHHLEVGQQQFRGMLTASQQAKFDRDRIAMVAAMSLFEGKLREWSTGEYELREFWDDTPQYRDRIAREQAAETQAEADAARDEAPRDEGSAGSDEFPKRIAAELNAWEKHVAEFCDKYELDRSQRNTANSVLREMLLRAETYARANRQRILAVERIIDGDELVDQPEFDAELKAVFGPIDNMFSELDERLMRLPTDAQLRRVGVAEGFDRATPAKTSMLPPKPLPTPSSTVEPGIPVEPRND